MRAKLQAQLAVKSDPKLQTASRAYLEFLRIGGEIRMSDLTRQLTPQVPEPIDSDPGRPECHLPVPHGPRVGRCVQDG